MPSLRLRRRGSEHHQRCDQYQSGREFGVFHRTPSVDGYQCGDQQTGIIAVSAGRRSISLAALSRPAENGAQLRPSCVTEEVFAARVGIVNRDGPAVQASGQRDERQRAADGGVTRRRMRTSLGALAGVGRASGERPAPYVSRLHRSSISRAARHIIRLLSQWHHPGNRLGPHEILAPVGAGGMGEVWKARDTRLDRIVAIKTIHGLTVSFLQTASGSSTPPTNRSEMKSTCRPSPLPAANGWSQPQAAPSRAGDAMATSCSTSRWTAR